MKLYTADQIQLQASAFARRPMWQTTQAMLHQAAAQARVLEKLREALVENTTVHNIPSLYVSRVTRILDRLLTEEGLWKLECRRLHDDRCGNIHMHQARLETIKGGDMHTCKICGPECQC